MAEATQNNSKRLEIRKYPNRRYYDTVHSRHVTLDEIYSFIRDGYEVQVTDSKSGQDITAKVLAQIIIELDPLKLGVFPVALLHRLLRSNEALVQDFVSKYFNHPLAAFLDSQRNFEQHLRQAMGLHTGVPTVSDWTRMMWGPFNPSMWSGQKPAASEAPVAGAVPESSDSAAAAEPQADAQDLRQVVESLQRQVERLKAEQTGRKRRKPSRKPGK